MSTAFDVQPSTAPLGNEISGLDISRGVDAETFDRLKQVYADKSVLVFRDQTLTPEQHIAFSRGFGELEQHVVERYQLPGYPEIFRVSNIVENGQRIGGSGEFWHTDLSYVENPSRGSLLYAVEVPVRNNVVLGDTEFASTAAAYDALSDAMKKRLHGLRALHRFGDVYAKVASLRGTEPTLSEGQKRKTPDVVHPIVITHAYSGRKSLFVNEGFTVSILGMEENEGADLLAELYAHCKRPEFVYRHRWRVGDLVMWDNWATVHRGTGGYSAEERRLMHRTTLKSPLHFSQLGAAGG